ncbi:ABC transporter permease [Chelatococcus sp. SYSU_G07232]|uniref:ABC transporter permease n=1 Tax=Chelatococcus albus TaxID=3047466 RepID=A0ABT7ACA8_9HYPH|nr:ABC transporter permease [Chelatococcus sp. SYSU_G07232]MDJ1156667.1 ABC transporter permease [Chelatococcus sp. SYSU_G07232]
MTIALRQPGPTGTTLPVAPKVPPHPGTVSLARSSLLYEWKRYLAAVLAVAFSGLLVIVQVGLLVGMFATATQVVDRARADLWVVEGKTLSFDLARDMPARIEMRLRAHPAVATVQSMAITGGDWRGPGGGKVLVLVTGFDVTDGSLSLPRDFDEAKRLALREVGAVIVDEIDLAKLGVGVGDIAEINGRRVRVVGTTSGMRAIGGANVFASKATVASLSTSPGSGAETQSYFLIKLQSPDAVDAVQEQLQALSSGDEFKVLKPDELSVMTQLYWLIESGAGAGFGFSALLGLIVGIAITSQTLRGAILTSLREYATLRALGVPVRALRRVVMEQSLWVGLAGLLVTAVTTWVVAALAAAATVAIAFPWWSMVGTAAFTLAVALVSGLFSLRPLYRTEPAELLR